MPAISDQFPNALTSGNSGQNSKAMKPKHDTLLWKRYRQRVTGFKVMPQPLTKESLIGKFYNRRFAYYFLNAPDSLKQDNELVKQLMESHRDILFYAHPNLQTDPELAALYEKIGRIKPHRTIVQALPSHLKIVDSKPE